METWNNLIDKFDHLLTKIKLDSTVKISGREIPPLVMGFALVAICIGIWTYLEFAGGNKIIATLIGAVVVILFAWAVAQFGALGLGDGIGEKVTVPTAEKSSSMDASETQPDQQQRLMLLTFGGVIVALFVIFQMRNIDSVQEMRTEFRYSELVDMVKPIQDTIEAALLSGSTNAMDFLDSGASGLPDEVLVSAEAHGISIIDGQIIATWKTDESDLDGVTYILTPKIEDGEVEWATTGTCGGKNAC
ncbi:hypothetical protein E3V39_01350 [Gammaproteobacteria bacterium LSUCC0112]|nr:hypothetical protein E3V39_01350 [Gammaproteobacteria bacterium LSUCC0112]